MTLGCQRNKKASFKKDLIKIYWNFLKKGRFVLIMLMNLNFKESNE